MKNLKKKRYSCFPKQQLLVENFRGFVERERLEEEVDKAMKYHLQKILAEGQLTEGIGEKWRALKEKWLKKGKSALSVSAMIATLASGLGATPAEAGFMEDAKKMFDDQIEQAITSAQKTADQMGIEFKKDVEVDQNVEDVKAEKEWNDRTFKTIDDAAKEAVKQADPTGKSIEGGLENPQWQEHEHFFKTKELARQYADHQKRTFNAPNTFPVKVASRAGGKKHGWIVIELQPSESALQQIYGGMPQAK